MRQPENTDPRDKQPPTPTGANTGDELISGEPGMPEGTITFRQELAAMHSEVRTGVGTPDEYAEAGGAELGADTGDIGTPRNEIESTPGGTAGTEYEPNTSTVVRRMERGQTKGIGEAKRRAV